MMKINIDKNYTLDFVKSIMAIDSPSGYTSKVMDFIANETKKLGFDYDTTNKGNGIITICGKDNSKFVGLAAHVDTLGAMITSITANGTLKLTNIGGVNWTFLNGEYCKIYTRCGKIYSGTIISNTPSVHVHGAKSKEDIKVEKMEVRLDEIVKSKDDVLKLGIAAGDFVCFDTRTQIFDNGFIKSRFLDDKVCVALLFGFLKYLKDSNITPKNTIKIIISTYEEVGHGSAYLPSDDIKELIAVDMGCIGEDLTCTEYDVSICPKDSSGPYDYGMTTELVKIAKDNNLPHAIDIYPFYGSDASAALRAGNDIRAALIGPGVYASHGLERTHYEAVEATIKLLILYTT